MKTQISNFKKLVALLFAGLFVLTLAACSDGEKLTVSAPDPSLVGVDAPTATLPRVRVAEDGASVVYEFGGSSSCPPLVTEALYNKDDKKLILTFKEYEDERGCDTDYVISAQLLVAPEREAGFFSPNLIFVTADK